MSDDWWAGVPGGPEDGGANDGTDCGAGKGGDGGAQGNGHADNPARKDRAGPAPNEVVFELRGQTRVGRITFKAIEEIERRTGVGVFDLAQRIRQGDCRFTDIAVVVTAALRDPPRPVPDEEIGEAVVETGMTRLVTPVYRLLDAALLGTNPNPPRGPAKVIDLAKYRAAKEPKDSS